MKFCENIKTLAYYPYKNNLNNAGYTVIRWEYWSRPTERYPKKFVIRVRFDV